MTNFGPVRHSTMRERNLAVVLEEVARHQPITRARLAEATGFTKTTVSNLLAVLADRGLVQDGQPVHEGERGRPGVAVSIDGNGAAGLGLEINVDYLAACVLDLGRRVRYQHLVAAENRGRSPEAVIAALAGLAHRALEATADQGLSVAGAMVALPGLLERGTGRLLRAPNLGWSEVAAGSLLRAGLPALPLPVDQDNEANLAALGELWFGAGPAIGDFVHVSGEIGIGAGVIVDGQIFRGAHGFAGELGHLVVDPAGPACSCGGRGCLEQVAGQEAILRAAGLTGRSATLAGTPDGPLTELTGLLENADPAALAAVAAAGTALGTTLASAINLFDPDTIVLGGVFSPLAPWIRPTVEAGLRGGSGILSDQTPPIVISALAGDAAVLGAAGLVIERVIADPARLF